MHKEGYFILTNFSFKANYNEKTNILKNINSNNVISFETLTEAINQIKLIQDISTKAKQRSLFKINNYIIVKYRFKTNNMHAHIEKVYTEKHLLKYMILA